MSALYIGRYRAYVEQRGIDGRPGWVWHGPPRTFRSLLAAHAAGTVASLQYGPGQLVLWNPDEGEHVASVYVLGWQEPGEAPWAGVPSSEREELLDEMQRYLADLTVTLEDL